MKLDEALKERIEKVVSRLVPDERESEAFDLFLDELAKRDGALYREAVEELYGQGATPAEEQAARIARKERVQTWLTHLFYHPNARGAMVVDKRKTGLLVSLAVASLMAVVYVLATRLPLSAPPEMTTGGAATTLQVPEPRPEVTVSTQAVEASDRPPPSSPPPRQRLRPAAPLAVAQPPRTTPPPLSSPPPSSIPPTAAIARAETEVVIPLPTEMSLLSEAMTAPSPSSMSLTGQVSGLGAGLRAPVSQTDIGALSTGVTTTALPERMALEDQAATMEQKQASLTLEASPTQLAEATTPMSLPVASSGTTAPPDASPQVDGGEGPRFGQAADGLTQQQEPAEPNPVRASQASTALPSALPLGTRLPATLTTAVVLLEGGAAPVVAETAGNWCDQSDCPKITWLGEASLVQPNRVELEFTQAVVGDTQEQVRAVAFGPDALPGVPAAVRDTTPTLAQDLLQGAAGGVTRYVEALAEQQIVTEARGRTVIEGAPPSLENFLLGGVADLFDIPDDQTTVVRVAEVPTGTPVTLLYGVDPGR